MQMKKSKSYYYWKAREQAQDQAYKAEEERYLQYINKQYDRAMDQIQKEIDSFYAKYATSEGISIAEAKKRVSKLDIEEYSRKAEKYVRDKTFTKKANEEMRLYNATMRINRLEMLKANIGLETVSAQSDVEKYLDEILEGRTREEIKHQAGILGESVNTNTDKAIAAIVNGSFRNSKYTAKWSDTLWKNQTLLKSELDRLLTKGLTQGKNSRALASELRKSINAEKSVAERLMRTELARVSVESGLSLMEENEYDEYMYMTLSFKDGKICDDCKALDGKHFKRKDAEVGFNLPPMHPNCRCSIAPYEDEDIDALSTPDFAQGNSETKITSADDEAIKKSLEQRGRKLETLLSKHVSSKSEWSGTIVLAEECQSNSKLWNCDIRLDRSTTEHIQQHEHLHARSISVAYREYGNFAYYYWVNHVSYEDLVVEFMNREIDKREEKAFRLNNDKYQEGISYLKKLNKKLKAYKTDYEFAKALFETPLLEREVWLDDLITSKSSDLVQYNQCKEIVKKFEYWSVKYGIQEERKEN